MSKKTILFNPDLLSTNKNKTIKKKNKPPKSSLVRPNKLRSQLINKIKTFQKRENKKDDKKNNKEENNNINLETFTNDFNDSINFLENISNKVKSNKIPIQPAIQPVIQQGISGFKILNNESPPYSTLKNGSKPTYREWIKNKTLNNTTLKKEVNNEIKIHDKDDKHGINIPTERSVKLQELKKEYKKKSSLPRNYIIKQIKTIKYKLGKKDGKVSVLIKNNETRKKIKKECGILKQTSIKDIKDYLRKQNLLKIGSIAPNDVLRKMYEQSILSGEINNKNGDTLIHNFFN